MQSVEHARYHRVFLALLCLGVFIYSPSVLADTTGVSEPQQGSGLNDVVAATPVEQVVATVNGKPIGIGEFNANYVAAMRKRFYHGKVPESEAEAVRKEVMDSLIEDVLLVEEAERRGFKPDEAKLQQAVAAMDARYGAVPEWRKDREQVLSRMKEQVGRQNLVEQTKKVLHDVPQPTPDEVRAYYEQNPKLFTEPEKLRLSVILLTADPGVPSDWVKAREKAQEIYLRLKEGADFAELARQYSGDSSAGKGGNLGFVHVGMLQEGLQTRIDNLQIGMVAEPTRTLEGVALYRLDERVAPVLREFAEVESRAAELLKRDLEDRVWKENMDRLRGDAKIEIIAPIASGKPTETIAPTANDNSKKKDDKGKIGKKKGGKK